MVRLALAVLLLVCRVLSQIYLESACCGVRLVVPHACDDEAVDHRHLLPYLCDLFADLLPHFLGNTEVAHQFVGAVAVEALVLSLDLACHC